MTPFWIGCAVSFAAFCFGYVIGHIHGVSKIVFAQHEQDAREAFAATLPPLSDVVPFNRSK